MVIVGICYLRKVIGMQKIEKERIIYDNYSLTKNYPDEDIDEMLIENGVVESVDEITDDMRWQWRYREDEDDWECEKERLNEHFEGKTVGFFGEVGRWNGVYKAGEIGEFWQLFNKAITDCDYIRIYDKNGHMHLTCSHHDGTCHFELKEVTDAGVEYENRYNENWNDKRKEYEVITQIFKRYSKLPRFAEKVYGCKPREYEPMTKETILRKLGNEAKSFYS